MKVDFTCIGFPSDVIYLQSIVGIKLFISAFSIEWAFSGAMIKSVIIWACLGVHGTHKKAFRTCGLEI